MMDSESKRDQDEQSQPAPEAEAKESESRDTQANDEAMAGATGDDSVEETGDGDNGNGEEVGSPVIEEMEIPTVEDDSELVVRLEAEIAELKDKVLRQAAETENVRRRLQRDKEDAVRYASVPLVRDLLGAIDNLERALDSLPEGSAEDDGPMGQLVAGIELTRKELASVFERHKVMPVPAQGARLDPNLHEAMFEVQDPSVPSGTIVQVLQSGYTMHDRLVRAARVGVAKGGPAPGPAPANDPGNPDAPEPGSHLDTEA